MSFYNIRHGLTLKNLKEFSFSFEAVMSTCVLGARNIGDSRK